MQEYVTWGNMMRSLSLLAQMVKPTDLCVDTSRLV